jgi:CBS domain-containing protein
MHGAIVKSWMSHPPITIGPNATLLEACQRMHAHGIRRLPVVDEAGRLLGIVTRGDVRAAWPSAVTSLMQGIDHLLESQPLTAVMTHHPITVTPETSLEHAAGLMLQHKISGLPVVDEAARVVGVITECDLFRLLIQEQRTVPSAI